MPGCPECVGIDCLAGRLPVAAAGLGPVLEDAPGQFADWLEGSPQHLTRPSVGEQEPQLGDKYKDTTFLP